MLDLLNERTHTEMLDCGKGVFEVRRRLVLEPIAPRLHTHASDYL